MLLAIDSSAGASAAVIRNDAVLASWRTAETTSHAEVLAPAVQRVLTASGLSGGRAGGAPATVQGEVLEAVVVGVGPAPFTGLRVGLALAHSLAEAWGLPLHGVCSLDSPALRAVRGGAEGEFAVATDARRREVYWALYRAEAPAAPSADAAAARPDRGGPFRLDGPEVGPAAEVPVVPVVGVGASLYPEVLTAAELPGAEPSETEQSGVGTPWAELPGTGLSGTERPGADPQAWLPDAVELGLLAAAALSGDEPVADGPLTGVLRQPLPLYLRESDAKVPQQMLRGGAA